MKKIAIDARPLQDASRFRGIGSVVYNLLENLKNDDNQFVIFQIKGKPLSEFPHLPVISFSPKNPLNYAKEMSQFLKDNNVTLFHFTAQYLIPDGWDFPFTITVHDLFNDHLYKNNWLYEKTAKKLCEKLAKAKHIVAISRFVKSSILEAMAYPEKQISVIYNGLDDRIKQLAEEEKSDVLTKFNIDKPFILAIGNYEKRKNLLNIMKAFLKFNQNKDYYLVACVNHKPLIMPMPELFYYRPKQMKFLSFIDQKNLAFLYKKAAVFCFASKAEGFGLPILEALSVKTPVITANATSMPEVGLNAVHYVDPESVTDIQNGLEKMVSDKKYVADKMTHADHVLNQFSYETCAKQLREVLLS